MCKYKCCEKNALKINILFYMFYNIESAFLLCAFLFLSVLWLKNEIFDKNTAFLLICDIKSWLYDINICIFLSFCGLFLGVLRKNAIKNQIFSFKMFGVFLKGCTFVVENIAMNFKTRGKLTINLTQCKYEKD